MSSIDLDDDEQSFQAALSFVDEFALGDGLVTLQSSSTSNSAASSTQGDDDDERRRRTELNARRKSLRKAGVYGNPNRARNDRRLEIVSLRQQVERLQIDLKKLRTRATVKKPQQPSGRKALVSTVLTPQMSTMWQEIADRQQRRRTDAEQENIRLKFAVERQRKVAKNLTSLLQRRASQLVSECSPFTDRPNLTHHIVVHALDIREDGIYHELLQRLDAAYKSIDTVFAANGLADTVLSPSDVHIQESDEGKFLELFANKVLPFRFEDAKEAAWTHLRGPEKHWGNGVLYEKAAKDLDESYTIFEDFTKEVHSHNARAEIRIKQVLRRYVEKDRDVIMWVSHASPVAIKHKMLRGLSYYVQAYLLTKRSQASTQEREVSQLQSCSLISFDQVQGIDNFQVLSSFLAYFSAQNMRAHQIYIENALVDKVLQQRVQ